MISVIAEHSVDLDLLPDLAKILDLGCRGFRFANEMANHIVVSVDIDDLGSDHPYLRCAVSDFDGLCGIINIDDKQATKINRQGTGIDCYTLKSISQRFNVKMWDLIKMDIEGSEYEIIMSLNEPPAKQLSIEFHLHTGAYKIFEMNMMENKLKSLGYEFVKHDYTTQHGAGFNYWDSLCVLK